MAPSFKYLGRFVLALGLLFVMLALGLGYYSNTEAFRQMIREQLVATINSSMRGSISLERIEGSIWGDVTLHQVRLRYRDADIAQIPQLKLAYALLPLWRGQLQITRAEAAQPALRLVRDGSGDWNIAAALGSDTDSQSSLTVLLQSLALRGGDVDIRLDGAAPHRYRLKNLTAASRLAILPKGIEFESSKLTGRFESDKWPGFGFQGRLAYQDTNSPPTIAVDDLRVETQASRIKLSGRMTGFDNSQVDARLALEVLAPTDVARVFPDWPVRKVVTGQIEAKGLLDKLALTVALAASGATLDGNLTVNVATTTPSYRGTIRVAAFDARELIGAQQWAGVLDGAAKIEGESLAPEKIRADGVFAVRALQLQNWALGNLRLNATLRDGAASVDGELTGELGSADWRGKVTLANAPSYDFDLAVKNLDIHQVAADEQAPRSVLSFKGHVQGTGLALERIKAKASIEILPSTLGPVQVRDGQIRAALSDGRIRIAHASLRSADSQISVKGDMGLALDQSGSLDYEVRSENLTPWLSLVGRKGAGSMTLKGRAQGSLAALSTRGTLKTARLQFDGLSAASGAADFDLARQRGQAIPSGDISARLEDLKIGTELQRLDTTVKLLAAREIRIEARAQDRYSRSHTARATIDYRAADVVAHLSQLSLNLPDGAWALAQPAALTQRGESLTIENFRVRNQDRQVTLDGNISLSDAQAVNLTVDRFPLESLAPFLPKQPKITGLVALQAKIGGTAAAPQIKGELRLTDSTIGGQKYDGLVADASYGERQATINVSVRQDRGHSLNATGKLPLHLSWHDGWRSEVAGALDLRVQSNGLSVAFLNAYAAKTVSGIGGEVTLDVTARGALADPRLRGEVRLTGGKLKMTALNVDVSEITTAISFDHERLTIEKFSARAEDGRLTGSGMLSLKQYQIEDFKFSLAARHWPAIQTRRYQAHIGGNLELTGSLNAPRLAGRIDITEGNLRPDLAFLSKSSTPIKRDETITIVRRDGTPRPEPAKKQGKNSLNDSDLFKRLALDMEVHVPRNVWVRHPDAQVEISGQVRATKISGQKLQLVGSSEIIHGWAAFQGRRFEFVRGEIRFIGGGEIDPALDILARSRLPQYTVDAVIGGTAEKPTLVLRSDPVLDQADILALLMFGKPTKDLSGGEQASLQQSAVDIGSGFAAAKIGSAVAEAIGLDVLGFDLGDFNFSGGRVGYGRYIGRQTYVSFSQELAGEHGQKATVEYQFSRDWKLESSTTSTGASGADIIWRKRY